MRMKSAQLLEAKVRKSSGGGIYDRLNEVECSDIDFGKYIAIHDKDCRGSRC